MLTKLVRAFVNVDELHLVSSSEIVEECPLANQWFFYNMSRLRLGSTSKGFLKLHVIQTRLLYWTWQHKQGTWHLQTSDDVDVWCEIWQHRLSHFKSKRMFVSSNWMPNNDAHAKSFRAECCGILSVMGSSLHVTHKVWWPGTMCQSPDCCMCTTLKATGLLSCL